MIWIFPFVLTSCLHSSADTNKPTTAAIATNELYSLIKSFTPGEVWNDIKGNPINAHGGGVLYHEGTYYWYGEYKIKPVPLLFIPIRGGSATEQKLQGLVVILPKI